jgi:hypothetical protein
MASERILCTGTIVASGEIDWHISPLTGEYVASGDHFVSEVSDGDIQRLIDEAAELEDYQEWIADQDFWRTGNW